MEVLITVKKKRGARSSAIVDGNKVSLKKGQELVVGQVPIRIISSVETDTLIYNI